MEERTNEWLVIMASDVECLHCTGGSAPHGPPQCGPHMPDDDQGSSDDDDDDKYIMMQFCLFVTKNEHLLFTWFFKVV